MQTSLFKLLIACLSEESVQRICEEGKINMPLDILLLKINMLSKRDQKTKLTEVM